MSGQKVVILGPIPRDRIQTHHGEVIEKYGCVTHTTIAISKLLEDADTVIPVTNIKKVDEDKIREVFRPYPNIALTHINSQADQGDVIHLNFVDQNKRIEKQTAFMNPIEPKHIADLMDADLFIFVPVTDFEVPLETLKYIKSNSDASIVFDAHGPTNTLTITGDRLMKFWVDRDRWLPYIDVLKMNLEEAHCSWFEGEYDLVNLQEEQELSLDKLPDFAHHCLSMGVQSVLVTLDSRGVMVYSMENNQLKERLVKSVKVDHVVDTTGCGDSFAAGVGFGILKHPNNYDIAAQYGNILGAQRTQGKTFEVFKSYAETQQILLKNYR